MSSIECRYFSAKKLKNFSRGGRFAFPDSPFSCRMIAARLDGMPHPQMLPVWQQSSRRHEIHS
jgi:hypothetical protein